MLILCLEHLSLHPSCGEWCPADLVQFTDVFSVSCLVLSENLD